MDSKVGAADHSTDGKSDDSVDGTLDLGTLEGDDVVGLIDGTSVGVCVGNAFVGSITGVTETTTVGLTLGSLEGLRVGIFVDGLVVGSRVGSILVAEGNEVEVEIVGGAVGVIEAAFA